MASAMFAGVFASTATSEMAAAAGPPLNVVLVSRLAVHAGGCATDLGDWAKVSGLGDSWIVSARLGGDASNHRWYLPGSVRHPMVKLTRAVGSDTVFVKNWLTDIALSSTPTAVTITYVVAGQPLISWTLQHVLPVKWSVNAFDASGSKLAIETLELSHQGIVPGSPCSSRVLSPLP
jgi:phage tail-like protein